MTKITEYLCISFIAIFLMSCGSNQVIISPNYNNSGLIDQQLDTNPKILNVIDNRVEKTKQIGIAQVGAFNRKVPYLLDEDLSVFVKKSVNKIITSKSSDSIILPVQVAINKFQVYEKNGMFSEIGNFDCELKFIYPISQDSTFWVSTETHQEYSGMDVTDDLENLIYKGITDCVEKFITKFNEHKSDFSVSEYDSSFKPQNLFSNKQTVVDSVKIKVKKRKGFVNMGLSYATGNNTDYGIQLLYQNSDSLKTNLYGGFGYSVQYLKIKDTFLLSDAFFLNYGFRYAIRY